MNHRVSVPKHLAAALLAIITVPAFAQPPATGGSERVEILNAERWEFDKDVATGAQRLIGQVRFKQGEVLMQCDSAYLHEDERVTAFGNVLLTQGDTLRITGDRLDYSGHAGTARITGDVHLSDPGMELGSTALLYEVKAQRAVYTNGARIVSKRDQSVLTSGKGAYSVDGRSFVFGDSVVLVHPEWTIQADTLHYNTITGRADFFGPTHITQGATRMYCERGSYNTRTGQGRFTKAARMASEGQTLAADTLHYDRNAGEGAGWGHVTITDTVNDLLVRGRMGTHRQQEGAAMVTGRAELVMIMDQDSLFLHADTLFARQDSLGHRHVDARRNVRFFKSDLQGVCDTMAYNGTDSLITLRGGPFIWSNADQISGDTIRIKLRDGHAETLHVEGSAFMISQADTIHFDQVIGLTMTGRFHNDQLTQLIAEGNSRTAYFAREMKDSVEQVTGLNRADCSRITVGLDSGQVSTVSFITQPEAVLYPLDQAPPEEMRLEGFRWNAAARPVDREDIFREPASDTAIEQPATDN